MHPSQQYSCNGSHKKALPQKQRTPKLTVERLVNAVPKIGEITQRQLASRVNCSALLTSQVANQAIAEGLIECFSVCGTEKIFRRVPQCNI